MKFTWFNLMPWPYLPDDFREKHRSVWVDIPNTLYDPRKGHVVYHTYLDQLEYAETLGFDGIGCNEHHQNGYGLMPSPNLIAATPVAADVARRAVRDRQLDRRLQPADPSRRGVRHARRDLRRAAHRRLPGRHADGHQLLLRPDPRPHPRQVRRGARPDHEGVGQRRAVRLRRQVQPAPLGELLAEADPEAAPAHLHPGRRLHRDVGLLPRPRLQLLVPVVLRLPARQVAARRLLGARGQARQGRLALPRRLRPDHLRGRHRRRGRASSTPSTSSTSSTGACTCSRPSPIPPATARWRPSSTARWPSSRWRGRRSSRTSPGSSWWTSGSSSRAAPRPCASSSRSAIKGLRIGHLFCLFHNGNMPDWKTRHSSKLFAEKVMPHLRDLWPEWKHDDRWWMHPMDDRLRPEERRPGAEKIGQEWAR